MQGVGAVGRRLCALLKDILAPCALGGILNSGTIPHLRTRAICGCANNQLDTAQDARRLHERGIVFVPDFVASAGGIIGGGLEIGLIDQSTRSRRHLRMR